MAANTTPLHTRECGIEGQALEALRSERRCDSRDEELAAYYGEASSPAKSLRHEAAPTLAETLQGLMVPWKAEELEAAREPWPHAFQDGHTGLFPEGEVTILAAAGREGKTTVVIGVAAAMVVGHSLGGMFPKRERSVIVYSAEDDRAQYARKVAAQVTQWSKSGGELIMQRLLVPDLDDAGFAAARTLVAVLDGTPIASGTVDAIIAAVRSLLDSPAPPALLVFETASTLSEADETNPGFRVLILALRRIARELKVHVVLSHHVSQASLANLGDLNLATTDIRGGTALVNNARQTGLLVNLGSDSDPFPDGDARTVLRRMACPNVDERVTALVSLDSSKGITPPPLFFRWKSTDWGPAAVEIDPPNHLVGRPWRKFLEMVRAERAEQRAEAKAERSTATTAARVQKVLDAIAYLQLQRPQQPVTARQVRERAGMSAAVAADALKQGQAQGLLTSSSEIVRGRPTDVYRLTGHGTGGGGGNG